LKLIIYNLFLLLYKTGISLVGHWNPKARLWLEGRKNILNTIQSIPRNQYDYCIWMHCSSLGEFEQGRPVLEAMRKIYPGACIVLTFFSASGYEIRKNYTGADYIFYLPHDSPRNARLFIDAIQPGLVLWVKYDYWYYFLMEIRKNSIPLLLISGNFFIKQSFFKWYGSHFRQILQCFTHLFVQTPESKALLNNIGLVSNVSVSGDTRFDRVIEIAEQCEPLGIIEEFCSNHQVVVAGSTWKEDEEALDHFANTHTDIRFIIAPHEITATHIRGIRKLFPRSVCYSDLKAQMEDSSRQQAAKTLTADHKKNDDTSLINILIIDNIGMLSRLYKYAAIAYIGGGFGNDGIHNVLEAAVYGKPVIFGPVYEKFVEAKELINSGGAFSIENALELEEVLIQLLKNPDEINKASEASRQYVYAKRGATNVILSYINQNNLLQAK